MLKRIPTVSTFLVSVALLFGTSVASEQSILSVGKQSPNNIDQNRQGIRTSPNTRRRRKAIEQVTEVESVQAVRSAFGNALLQRRKSNLEHKLVGKTDAEEEIDAGNFWKFGGMSMPGGSDPGDSTGTSPNPEDDDENGGEDPPVESPPTTTSSSNPPVTIPTPAPTETTPVAATTGAPVASPGTTDPQITLAPTVSDADTPKPNSNMPGGDAPLPTPAAEDPDARTLAPTQLGFNTPPPTSGAQRKYSSIGGTLVLALGLLWAW